MSSSPPSLSPPLAAELGSAGLLPLQLFACSDFSHSSRQHSPPTFLSGCCSRCSAAAHPVALEAARRLPLRFATVPRRCDGHVPKLGPTPPRRRAGSKVRSCCSTGCTGSSRCKTLASCSTRNTCKTMSKNTQRKTTTGVWNNNDDWAGSAGTRTSSSTCFFCICTQHGGRGCFSGVPVCAHPELHPSRAAILYLSF